MPGGRSFVEGREGYILALLLSVAACAAGVVLYHIDRHVFLYFGDAASHIVKARQFVDSQRPGIHNIGPVWLPLPHILLLPFAARDGLFSSGIAGPVVGIPCFVGTGLLLFSMVCTLTGSRPIAFLSACLFGLNPNVIYMALTPMSEPSLLFFVTLGGYALLRWSHTGADRWLLLCAVAVMLATLCRYEAWLLAPFVSFVAAFKGISIERETGRSAAVVRKLLVAALCWAGIVFWLWWNQAQYADALDFAHGTYSAVPTASREYLQYQNQLSVLGTAVLNIFGPVPLFACAIAVLRLRRMAAEQRRPLLLLLLFLGLPPLSTLIAVLAGFVQVDQWWWNWRYVLTLGLVLSVASAIGLSEFFGRVRSASARSVAVACFLGMPLVQIIVPSVGVATFEDAAKCFDRDANTLGERLQSTYKGGSIALLTGEGQGQRIMVSSCLLPLERFHMNYNCDEKRFRAPLWASYQYVVIGEDPAPESDQFVDYWLSHRELLLRYYHVLLEDSHYVLMERKMSDPMGKIE